MTDRAPKAPKGTQQPLEAGALPDALLRIVTLYPIQYRSEVGTSGS